MGKDSGFSNSNRSYARAGVFFQRTKDRMIDHIQGRFDGGLDDIEAVIRRYFGEAYRIKDKARIWNFPAFRASGQDLEMVREIKLIMAETTDEVTSLGNRYALAAGRESYQRAIHEFLVEMPKDLHGMIVRDIPTRATMAEQLLSARGGQALIETTSGFADVMVGEGLRSLVGSMVRGRTLDETVHAFRKNFDKSGHFRNAAQNQFYQAVGLGRESAIADNTDVVETQIFMTLKDGHRICPICKPLHGKLAKPILQEFGPLPLHPGCYCYTMVSLKYTGGAWQPYKPWQDPWAEEGLGHVNEARQAAEDLAQKAERDVMKEMKNKGVL